MTAEIAIVNRQAIALAADSAVTIGRERVWKLANKLFSLGPENDIAIMIYNNGEFAGFPWELIVKTFRAERRGILYKTVKECGDDFMLYLEDARFVPDDLNKTIHLFLLTEPMERMQNRLRRTDLRKSGDFRAAVMAECDQAIHDVSQLTELPNAPSLKVFRGKYHATIKAFALEIFGRAIGKSLCDRLVGMIHDIVRHETPSTYFSGVVVAGYGKEQFFPQIMEYSVDGKDDLSIRKWVTRNIDTNATNQRKTYIVPFGQTDIFHLFMEGISPSHLELLENLLSSILASKSESLIQEYVSSADRVVETAKQRVENGKIIERFLTEFGAYRIEDTVQPIVDVVRALPKEEMAYMAQALVELTSLRRKVDSNLESVGGPVDIAIISKGDGLIWIKRKHYFDLDKNRDYLYRKFATWRAGHEEQ